MFTPIRITKIFSFLLVFVLSLTGSTPAHGEEPATTAPTATTKVPLVLSAQCKRGLAYPPIQDAVLHPGWIVELAKGIAETFEEKVIHRGSPYDVGDVAAILYAPAWLRELWVEMACGTIVPFDDSDSGTDAWQTWKTRFWEAGRRFMASPNTLTMLGHHFLRPVAMAIADKDPHGHLKSYLKEVILPEFEEKISPETASQFNAYATAKAVYDDARVSKEDDVTWHGAGTYDPREWKMRRYREGGHALVNAYASLIRELIARLPEAEHPLPTKPTPDGAVLGGDGTWR